jgi:hypothetical protein
MKHFIGPRFFLSNTKAVGLRWLKEHTGIPPRWFSLHGGTIRHYLEPHKKIDRLLKSKA